MISLPTHSSPPQKVKITFIPRKKSSPLLFTVEMSIFCHAKNQLFQVKKSVPFYSISPAKSHAIPAKFSVILAKAGFFLSHCTYAFLLKRDSKNQINFLIPTIVILTLSPASPLYRTISSGWSFLTPIYVKIFHCLFHYAIF